MLLLFETESCQIIQNGLELVLDPRRYWDCSRRLPCLAAHMELQFFHLTPSEPFGIWRQPKVLSSLNPAQWRINRKGTFAAEELLDYSLIDSLHSVPFLFAFLHGLCGMVAQSAMIFRQKSTYCLCCEAPSPVLHHLFQKCLRENTQQIPETFELPFVGYCSFCFL